MDERTKHLRARMFFIAIALCLLTFADKAAADDPKQILFLNSYHEGYKGTDDIVAGFRKTLKRELGEVLIVTEYMDSKNFSGDEYDAKFLDILRYKYKGRHFDLLVASDDYAFNFVEKNYDELFAPTPVVFCGTNAFDVRRIEGKSPFVGVDEMPSFRETLELMLRIRPGTKRILAITDDSLAGQINVNILRTEAGALSGKLQIDYLEGRPLEELVDRVRALGADTQVLYFASIVKDRSGKSYRSRDALKLLSDASTVPFFGGWEFNLGYGIVGGRLVELSEHGALAGRLAVEILRGRNPADLPRLSPSPNLFIFDDAMLRRFGISDDLLPAESVIINRPPTFYEKYRAEIFIAVSLVLSFLVLCFIVFLYWSRLKLQRALQEIKTLQGILPICASCKKIRDDSDSWHQLEVYISRHSEAQFSHGICPDCMTRLYPDLVELTGDDSGKQGQTA